MLSTLSRHIRLASCQVVRRSLSTVSRVNRSTAAQKAPETHEFKAETRKLLNIVARSLYTDKEVFIRELISNSSDALEKLRYLDATHQILSKTDAATALGIKIELDEKNRIFTISDTGIGMTRDELILNLGTIARSGSKEFVTNVNSADTDSKIIGQFGVGFYSTFVVADKVEVYSRHADASKAEQGYRWTSEGLGSFTIEPSEDISRGTKIVLYLKEDALDFCSLETVKSAASKFSAFVDFPLSISENGKVVQVNQQEALWLKPDASESQHTEFFRFLGSAAHGEPLYTLSFHTDAPLSIKSVFYIPDEAPDRWFQSAPKVQVALHSRRVLVKKHAEEIIPSWLHWVRGVVDCDDMPLNISRESMQDTALLKKLSTAVVRRILRFLADDDKKYETKYHESFWRKFGFYLKAGLLEDQQHNSQHKEQLIKLVRFSTSSGPSRLISLQEYVDSMGEGQKNIYYIHAPSREAALASPYLESLADKQVLILTEDIDEFMINYIASFKDHKLISVSAETDVERSSSASTDVSLSVEEKTSLESVVKAALGEKASQVKFTDKLKASPAVVTSQISPHMRKMMKNMMKDAGQSNLDALDGIPVTLELNENHRLVRKIAEISQANPALAKIAIKQLFDNACIAAGMIEDSRLLLANLNEMLEFCVFQETRNE